MVREAPDGDVTVPPTIQALLAARLDLLDAQERGVLSCGAVEGRLFHRGAVEALAPKETQVAARLTALVRKELVRPDKPQLSGEEAFRFRHLLIRDAAYDSLPKATRAALHERFADWLEERGTDLVELDEVVGYHLEQAYRYRAELGPLEDGARRLAARASQRLAAAGRRALGRRDLRAAVNLLERAVSLRPARALDVDLELDLAEALFGSGKPLEAEAVAASAAERAAAAGDRRGELRSDLERALVRSQTDPEGATEELLALVEEAMPVFEEAGDDLGFFSAWRAIASVEHGRCRHEAKLVAAERACEHARRIGDERRERALLPWLITARYFGPTPVVDVLRWLDEQESAGGYDALLGTQRAGLLAMLGRFDEARALLAQARARQDELGALVGRALGAGVGWEVEMLAGDPAAAEREAREGCELLAQMGERAFLSTQAGELAEALYALGRYDEAEQWAETGRELGASDDVITQMLWRQVRGKVLALRGDFEEAEQLAREAVALAEQTDMIDQHGDALMDLAEVLDLASKAPRAELEQALALYERKGNLVMADRAQTRLADLRT